MRLPVADRVRTVCGPLKRCLAVLVLPYPLHDLVCLVNFARGNTCIFAKSRLLLLTERSSIRSLAHPGLISGLKLLRGVGSLLLFSQGFLGLIRCRPDPGCDVLEVVADQVVIKRALTSFHQALRLLFGLLPWYAAAAV